MNILARIFSYPLLERQLERERNEFQKERLLFQQEQERWRVERRMLVDAMLRANGKPAVFQPPPKVNGKPSEGFELPSVKSKRQAVEVAEKLVKQQELMAERIKLAQSK